MFLREALPPPTLTGKSGTGYLRRRLHSCVQPDPRLLQAFAEYFTQMQLTTLVLTAMEGLTDSRAKLSLAAAQLISGVMQERGRDMIKVVWCCGDSPAPRVRALGVPLALPTSRRAVAKSLSSVGLNSFTSKM